MRVETTVPLRLILEVSVNDGARGCHANVVDVCREDHATLPHAEAPDEVVAWVAGRFREEIQRAAREAIRKLTEDAR